MGPAAPREGGLGTPITTSRRLVGVISRWKGQIVALHTADDSYKMIHCLLIQSDCVSLGLFAHMLHFWGTRPSNRWSIISQGFFEFLGTRALPVLYQFQSASCSHVPMLVLRTRESTFCVHETVRVFLLFSFSLNATC